MNRTIKEATVRAFHYASAHELKQHLHAFLLALFSDNQDGFARQSGW
jgi:hypothetical protein